MIAFLDDRLQSKIWERCTPEPNSGCWLWIGSVHRNGYGRVYAAGRHWNAHRYVYTVLVSTVPQELQLDHLCRNTLCVNPAHLEPVTPRVNTLRSEAVTAINAQATHCKHGHELTEDNVIRVGEHGRGCRACHNRRRNEHFGRLGREERDAINARVRERRAERNGLRNIRENGIDAELRSLDEESRLLPGERVDFKAAGKELRRIK